MYAEHDIRSEKCSDTCQYKIKFVLTFGKNDQTLYSRNLYCSIKFWPGHLSHQLGFVQVNPKKCSENVRSLTVISCSGML